MRPPAPRTAWHWTHPLATKSDCPRVGSPIPARAAIGRSSAARTIPIGFLLMNRLRRHRQVTLHAGGDFFDGVLPPLMDLPDRDDGKELREDRVEKNKRRQE